MRKVGFVHKQVSDVIELALLYLVELDRRHAYCNTKHKKMVFDIISISDWSSLHYRLNSSSDIFICGNYTYTIGYFIITWPLSTPLPHHINLHFECPSTQWVGTELSTSWSRTWHHTQSHLALILVIYNPLCPLHFTQMLSSYTRLVKDLFS